MSIAGPASFADLLEHALPELAEATRSGIEQIVGRWDDSVRRFMPAADKLTFAQLRDDSVAILRQLADALASTDPVATATLVESSRQRADIRFHEQSDLCELIVEYRLLRRITIEEVECVLARSMSVAEQVALNMGIDAMLQRAVLAFVEYQQDRLRAVTEKATQAAAAAAEQAKLAAWAIAEQATAAAWAASEQAAVAVAVATEQATAAVALATEQAKVALAVATEQAKAAAMTISEEARAAAWASSEQARDVAAASSQEATAVALATSEKAKGVAWGVSEHAAAVAAAASRIKDHFLAVLGHELRNPLTPVLATASLLQLDDRFDEETRGYLEIIRRNAELEARLIDDLLDVTRISHGKVQLDRRPVALSTILRHAVEVCQGDIDARHVRFELDIKDPPHWLHADAGRLEQVFWNIIKNAVKFTPPDGSVVVRAFRQDDSAVVEVTDSGIGIEPEAIGRVFSVFEQADVSVTRRFGGLGLGLAISKALVELHGGTITAQSPGKGKGAMFTVRLPTADGPSPIEAGIDGPPPSQSLETADRKLRILLVEDQEDTARILSRILTKAGHTVQRAGDVASALEFAAGSEFDLLLSDMGLPDGSGLDIVKELRQRGNPLRGIALSGYGQEEDVRLSLEAGFSRHLLKPVTAERLLAVVVGQD